MIGTEREQRSNDSNQLHNPSNYLKMFKILLSIRKGDDSMFDGFDIDFIEDILEEVKS